MGVAFGKVGVVSQNRSAPGARAHWALSIVRCAKVPELLGRSLILPP